MNGNPIFREKIKQYRKTAGMTQEELAMEIGVEAQHISSIERGTKGISLETLVRVCRKLNLNLDDLWPIEDFDDSLKEKWIADITDDLRAMDAVQVSIWKKVIGSTRE